MPVPFFRSGLDAIAKARLFARDERGAFAIMVALALIPILIAIGAAIDFAQALALRTKVQQGLDSAILQACKNAQSDSDSTLRQKAERQFNANVDDARASLSELSISAGRTSVTGKASANYVPIFGSFLVSDGIQIGADSSCQIANNTLEIALVIDTTGSMATSAGGKSKMDAAKEAATKFVNALLSTSAVAANRVEISIVPFSAAVNIGTTYRNATWMDTSGKSSIHWENITKPANATSRFTLFDQLGEAWGGCVETRPGTFATSDDQPTNAVPNSLYVPLFAPDEPGDKEADYYNPSTGNSENSWGTTRYRVYNSYVNDDGQGACSTMPDKAWATRQKAGCKYAINKSSSKKRIFSNSGTSDGALLGPNYMCSSKPLLRLTNDRTQLLNKISSLQAVGNTNILEGLMWGWRTISPNGPFADGREYSVSSSQTANRKFIVLMTDGDNTWTAVSNPNKSYYSAMGYFINNRIATGITSESQANTQMNNRTLEACRNIKVPRDSSGSEAVTIYTVGFSVAGDEISSTGLSLLQSCASTSGGRQLFYKATSAADIVSVFDEIANSIGSLRLTN